MFVKLDSSKFFESETMFSKLFLAPGKTIQIKFQVGSE